MRILSTLIVSLMILAVIGGVVGLGVREGLLFWGVAQVREDLDILRGISRNAGQYVQRCQQMGVVPNATTPLISELRLRFTSDTEYVVELICGQFRSRPIVVAENRLPQFVTKAPGTSGFIWDQEIVSGIILQVFGRERAVVVDGFQTVAGNPAVLDLGFGPKTSCGGYGYECCQQESSLGEGKQLTEVLDCPVSCYESCRARPVVLSVASNPLMDQATRTTRVSKGQPVTFSVVVESGASDVFTGTIDFGDGSTDSFTETSLGIPHTYSCSRGSCTYQVAVSVVDDQGVSSAQTPISTLTVVVQ